MRMVVCVEISQTGHARVRFERYTPAYHNRSAERGASERVENIRVEVSGEAALNDLKSGCGRT